MMVVKPVKVEEALRDQIRGFDALVFDDDGIAFLRVCNGSPAEELNLSRGWTRMKRGYRECEGFLIRENPRPSAAKLSFGTYSWRGPFLPRSSRSERPYFTVSPAKPSWRGFAKVCFPRRAALLGTGCIRRQSSSGLVRRGLRSVPQTPASEAAGVL